MILCFRDEQANETGKIKLSESGVDDNNMNNLLSEMIDEKGISKNNLIREIGVDRSTFYKLINGNRINL